MEIRKSGLLFKVAYGNRTRDRRPESVDLLTFGVRFLWMLLVYWPVVGALTLFTVCTLFVSVVALGAVVFLMLAIPGFLFCRKPMFFRHGYGTFDFTPYEKWPTMFGRRIYPFLVVIVLLSVTYPEKAKGMALSFLSALAEWTIFSKGFWITEASALFLFGLFALVKCSDEIAFARNMKAFVLARKRKYCPLMKVVE